MGSMDQWCLYEGWSLDDNPPPFASWIIWKLCKVTDQLIHWILADKYCINSVYKDLLGSHPQVSWSKIVWHRTSIPKARFVFWLAMLNKLKTKDHLMKMGVTSDACCPLCCVDTDLVVHLFFKCSFSSH